MAFIREYALLDEGDPFRFRLPKFRKIGRGFRRLGRGAFGLARRGLSLAGRLPIPIPGPVGTALALARRVGLEAGDFEDEEQLMDFARGYGYDLGDPGPKGPRRKQAASGTRAKAKVKKEKRRERRRRGPGRLERGLGAAFRGIGGFARKVAPIGGQIAGELLARSGETTEAQAAAAEEAELAGLVPAGIAGLPRGPMGGVPGAVPMRTAGGMRVARYTKAGRITYRKRPSMQVTNTRALRKSLTRVEGFAKLSKRIMPHIWRSTGSRRAKGGHVAGCRCIACAKKR